MYAMLKRTLPERVQVALRYARYGVTSWEAAPPVYPGMITSEERECFTRAARRVNGLPGVLVDLGCWMGATADALASGTQDPVYALDLFRWESWMMRWLPHVWCEYRPGDSFLPEARRRLQGHSQVQVLQADLSRYCWDGRPIKLLLVDAMKSWAIGQHIARSFFPSLAPGALLIHQDFKHYFCVWILLSALLRDDFLEY